MNLRWHLSHARGYLDLGMLAEAEAELGAIPLPESDRPEVHALRVTLLHERCDWQELRRIAAALVEQQPDEPGWWVSFAFAPRRTMSIEEAREILLAAERAHPQEAIIHFNLGCYACQLGEYDEARRRVWRSIELRGELRELAHHDPDLQPLRDLDPLGFAGGSTRGGGTRKARPGSGRPRRYDTGERVGRRELGYRRRTSRQPPGPE